MWGVVVTPRQGGAAGLGCGAGGAGDEGHRVPAQFLDFIASSNERELRNTLDVLGSKPFIFFLESPRPVLLPGILQKQLSPAWALKHGRHTGCSVAQAERNAQSDPGRGWPAGKELFEVEFVYWCCVHGVARLWAQENEATASWPLSPRPPDRAASQAKL